MDLLKPNQTLSKKQDLFSEFNDAWFDSILKLPKWLDKKNKLQYFLTSLEEIDSLEPNFPSVFTFSMQKII